MKPSMRLTRRLAVISADATSAAPVGVATTSRERLEAARLVGRLYGAEGYLDRDEPYFLPRPFRSEAAVFVAREGGRVVGTLTVVTDSEIGLPLEALYGDEVAALRSAGRVPCELCSLAVDTSGTRPSTHVLLGLFRIANAYAVHFTATTDALITLKPSHQDFYGRRLWFQDFGALKADPRFRGAETVAMRQTRERGEEATRLAPGLGRRDRSLAAVFAAPTPAELEGLRRAATPSPSGVR